MRLKSFERDIIHMQLLVYYLSKYTATCRLTFFFYFFFKFVSGFYGKTQKCSNSAKFFAFSKFCIFWDHCLSINWSSFKTISFIFVRMAFCCFLVVLFYIIGDKL